MTEFFNYKDFAFNSSWKVSLLPYRDSFILFVDDIYQHPERVYEYLSSCPIRSHKPTGRGVNGIDFYDGQQYLDNRWDPCRKDLFQRICDIYNIKLDDSHPNPPLSVYNTFSLVKDYPGDGKFFHPHIDDNLNILIYLNPEADGKYGTTLYTPVCQEAVDDLNYVSSNDTEHTQPWKDSSWYHEDMCIINKFNGLVAFPGHWPHGQTITDNFYKNKIRCTEVTFF